MNDNPNADQAASELEPEIVRAQLDILDYLIQFDLETVEQPWDERYAHLSGMIEGLEGWMKRTRRPVSQNRAYQLMMNK